jgi:hypothetical protein
MTEKNTMRKSAFVALKEKNSAARTEVEKVRKAPEEFLGLMKPGNLGKYSLTDIYRMGTFMWTKVSMTSILISAEELGWKEYINLLGKYQRPVQKARIDMLSEKYNIPKNYVGYSNMAHIWAKGCMFDVARHAGRSFQSDTATAMCNDRCPQIEALREMDLQMLKECPRLYYWCDAYDNMFLGHVNDHCWYSHVSCLFEEDKKWCISYMRDTNSPVKEETYFDKIVDLNGIARDKLDELAPAPEQGLYPLTWRNVEDVDMTKISRDGPLTKGGIAMESILCAVKGMGWERFLNLCAEKLDKGYFKALQDARDWAGVNGNGMDAALLCLTSIMFAMDFESHTVPNFGPDGAELVAPHCKIIDVVQKMGLEDLGEDMCLWCDFYFNYAVKCVNPDMRVHFTHCLGKKDGFCRAVLKHE